MKAPATAYILPFAIYMLFLAAGQASGGSDFVLYPIKAIAVSAALIWAWPRLRNDLQSRSGIGFGLMIGVLTFGAWIAPELCRWTTAEFTTGGFNPTSLAQPQFLSVIVCRVLGAVIVVPLMEEIFWRGWLLRWVVNEDFRTVPLGQFTWGSFAATVLLFGVEHGSLWHVGMIAGALYNVVLYRTRSLWACIAAHALTNLLLAIYVLMTGKWGYW